MRRGKKVTEAQKGEFVPAKSRIKLTPGESIKIVRELQSLSQAQFAEKCGIPQSTISAIESSRINLGVERAKILARALKVHPAVLLFAGRDIEKESVAFGWLYLRLPGDFEPPKAAVASLLCRMDHLARDH